MTLALVLLAAPKPDTSLLGQIVPETWHVTEAPLLRIGMESGPEEYLFEYIRGVVALPGGQLAVADAGHLTVRVYGSDGRCLYRMGRSGEGPGEFVSIYGVWLTEDGELAVWDDRARRIARFSQGGTHVETRPIIRDHDLMGNLQVFFGALSGGEVLLGALTTPVRSDGERSAAPYLLFRFHLSGVLRAAVGQVEGMWRYRSGESVIPLPFTPVPWAVTWEVRDRDGALVRTLPVPDVREASRSDRAAFQRALRARADELPGGPFYGEIIGKDVDPLGVERVVVRELRRGGSSR